MDTPEKFISDLAFYLLCSDADFRDYGWNPPTYDPNTTFQDYLTAKAVALTAFIDATKVTFKRATSEDERDENNEYIPEDLQMEFNHDVLTELARIFPCIPTLHADTQDRICDRYVRFAQTYYN